MYTLQIVPKETKLNFLYREHKNAIQGDSGIDLYFPDSITIPANSLSNKIDFKISCQLVNSDGKYVSYLLIPRSSISKTTIRMSNSIGLIDSEYTGNICAFVDNHGDKDFHIKENTRLLQIIAPKLDEIVVDIVDTHRQTSRGNRGFGSTG